MKIMNEKLEPPTSALGALHQPHAKAVRGLALDRSMGSTAHPRAVDFFQTYSGHVRDVFRTCSGCVGETFVTRSSRLWAVFRKAKLRNHDEQIAEKKTVFLG